MGIPVSGDKAFKSPFPTENICQQFFILTGSDAVDYIVRAHDRPWLCFFDTDFKSAEIDFTQGPLTEAGVGFPAVCLLIVACKMLQRCGYSLTLDAFHGSSCHHAGDQRILRVILKISAAERCAMNVNGRGKPSADPVFIYFRRGGSRHFRDEFRIPCGGKSTGNRKCRCFHAGFFLKTQAGRTVCRHCVWNTVLRDIAEAECICRSSVGLPAEKMNFHLICQQREKRIHGHFAFINVYQSWPYRRTPDTIFNRPGKFSGCHSIRWKCGQIIVRSGCSLVCFHRHVAPVRAHTLMQLLRCTLLTELLEYCVFFRLPGKCQFLCVSHIEADMEAIAPLLQNICRFLHKPHIIVAGEGSQGDRDYNLFSLSRLQE